MSNLWKALTSAYRAAVKQYKTTRTKQRNRASMPDPLGEQQ